METQVEPSVEHPKLRPNLTALSHANRLIVRGFVNDN